MARKQLAMSTWVACAALLAACAGPADGGGGTIVQPNPPTATESSQDSGSGDSAPQETTGETESETSDSSAQEDQSLGTRSNPAPIGSVARIDDWDVSIVSVTLDADDVVARENEFNSPPTEGKQFVLWNVSATYVGQDSGDPWFDFSWKVLGSAGNTFDPSQESCGVIPDSLSNQGETFPGGTVTGNVCIPVEIAQLDGALVIVEGFFGEQRTFFALG